MLSDLDNIMNTQKNEIDLTDFIKVAELKDLYYKMYQDYRNALNQYSNVILSLRNFVASSVFGGEYYTDTRFALLDLGAETVAVATSVEEILEIDYANDVYVIMDRYNEYNNGTNLFVDVREGDFLLSYVSLVKNSPETLNYLFSCKHSIKVAISNRNLEELSKIPENDQNNIVTLLKVLKY